MIRATATFASRLIAGLFASVHVIVAAPGVVLADELRLSAGEIDNLGVHFVQPASASDAGGIEATARVVLPAAGDVVISASHTGLLTSLAANVGDEVHAGQILAELSSPEFISLQREYLDAVSAQRLAQSEHDRDMQLHDEGIISTRRLQETTTRKAIADAALGEHRQLLSFAGMREADVRALKSKQTLQASLVLRAPFDGVIAARLASTGERLDPMAPVYRLADLTELWLDINLPQEHLAAVRPGAGVIAAGNAGTWRAVVVTVGQAIDPATQSAIVRARLERDVAGLMPGQFIAVGVLSGDLATGVLDTYEVPAAAVIRSGSGSYVFVRTPGGVAATRIELVSVTGPRAFIRGPIDTSDAIADRGLSALKSMWAADAEPAS